MKKVTKDMMIPEVLAVDVCVESLLMACGMHCVGCMAAHGETLEEAAMVHDINPDELVFEINQYLESIEE